eukprot:5173322-Pyramimonas_sp.AAC.1
MDLHCTRRCRARPAWLGRPGRLGSAMAWPVARGGRSARGPRQGGVLALHLAHDEGPNAQTALRRRPGRVTALADDEDVGHPNAS